MDRIAEIDTEKNNLLNEVNSLTEKHRAKYPACDCSLPFRAGEKESNEKISDLFSRINTLVIVKNNLKKQQNEKFNFQLKKIT